MSDKKSKIFKTILIASIVIIVFTIILFRDSLRIDRFGLAKISWVDCVKINDIKYYSDFDGKDIAEESSIGKKIGKVKFNVSKKVGNPWYKFRNGDATFLDTGTEIYSLTSTDEAIAVKIEEVYYIYRKK